MAQLFFKKYLQQAIRLGQKRTTLRRWSKPLFRAGQEAYSPGLGWLCIEGVEAVELEQLGDQDARADGFDSFQAMHAVLVALYPDHATDGKQWFRVNFRLRDTVSPTEDVSEPRLF